MLTPDHYDTNSLGITQSLNEAGWEVRFKTIVGDDEKDLADMLATAMARSALLIVSGGLGPTEDDVTRDAVARVLGRKLASDARLLDEMRARFARRGVPMAANNERQAEVIEGAEVLPNALGTAPGMWLEEHGTCIALLPGPPRELNCMLENHVLPRVQRLGRGRRLVRRSLRIAGLPESEVDSRVAPIYRRYPKIQTTILASRGHIGIHLRQWLREGDSPAELDELAGRIAASLGNDVFTLAEESLEEVVGRLLRASGHTLALAESCTAGGIGSRLTEVPGSSDYFLGGILCYSNSVKTKLCRVSEDLLEKHGAVSPEVAEALARGVRETLGSSLGLSATGIAGPGGGSAEKPVGLVYLGFADRAGSTHVRRVIPGDRSMVRERAAYQALAFLRRHLIGGEVRGQP